MDQYFENPDTVKLTDTITSIGDLADAKRSPNFNEAYFTNYTPLPKSEHFIPPFNHYISRIFYGYHDTDVGTQIYRVNSEAHSIDPLYRRKLKVDGLFLFYNGQIPSIVHFKVQEIRKHYKKHDDDIYPVRKYTGKLLVFEPGQNYVYYNFMQTLGSLQNYIDQFRDNSSKNYKLQFENLFQFSRNMHDLQHRNVFTIDQNSNLFLERDGQDALSEDISQFSYQAQGILNVLKVRLRPGQNSNLN